MTKAELQTEYDILKVENEYLKDELDGLNEAYCELERINADLTNSVGDYYISDVNNFISRMQLEGLYTPEMAQFIEYYMRYHNELDLG